MKFYIIHLARSSQRKGNVQRLQAELGHKAEIVEAIDAQNILSDANTKSRGHFPPYPFTLRASEKACFMSHRMCWEKIVQSEDSGAVVLEDDVVLVPDAFHSALSLVQRHCGPEDFVRFPVKLREKTKTLIVHENGTKIFIPKVCGLGMQAQYVGRQAAIRLLEATEDFDRPVDTTLQQTWVTKQTCLTLWPSGVTENSDDMGGSLIGEKKTPFEKAYREIARPVYRSALWLTAQLRRL